MVRENSKKIKIGESFGWLKGLETTQGDGDGPRRWRWPKGVGVAQGGGGGPRGWGWPERMEVAQGDGGGPRGWRWPKVMEVARGDRWRNGMEMAKWDGGEEVVVKGNGGRRGGGEREVFIPGRWGCQGFRVLADRK